MNPTWRSLSMVALALTLCVAGCDSDGGGSGGGDTLSGGGGGGGGGSQPAANCGSRCEDKAGTCGAPAAIATQMCAGICGENPTEEQAQCLERTSCSDLESAMMGGSLPCGIGEEGGGGGGGGDACDGGEPVCDGDALVTCVEIGGQPVEQRESCPAGCSGGRCLHNAELCDPGFDDGSGCDRDACNMSDVVIVDGVRYCTSSCGPDDLCPSGTECFPAGSQDICLPACTPGLRGECPDGFLDVPCDDEGACGL